MTCLKRSVMIMDQQIRDYWDKFGPVSMLTRMYDKLGRLDNLPC